MNSYNLPVFDLHCDLLSYLSSVPQASFLNPEIGCALPHLLNGNVKAQVMAIYATVESGSTLKAFNQTQQFSALLEDHAQHVRQIHDLGDVTDLGQQSVIGVIAAIENASGFCEEKESLDNGLRKLENMLQNLGRIFYISFTHHGENRFGGGNYASCGLKDDGKYLLEYLDKRQIAIDLAHTSDALAFDILNYIDQKGLHLPVIASHSNFRSIHHHARNLPDEIVHEIITRKGLIGINFLRAYVHDARPDRLYDHIMYGLQQGEGTGLCFGADFFYHHDFADHSRIPLFFEEHEDAGKYPAVLQGLENRAVKLPALEGLCYRNVLQFMQHHWS